MRLNLGGLYAILTEKNIVKYLEKRRAISTSKGSKLWEGKYGKPMQEKGYLVIFIRQTQVGY